MIRDGYFSGVDILEGCAQQMDTLDLELKLLE